MLKYSRVFLAPIEVEILLREKLFFVGFAERPTEVPAKPCKKSFWDKRLKRKAGNSSLKTSAKLSYSMKLHYLCDLNLTYGKDY
jgi:hypothetical protein